MDTEFFMPIPPTEFERWTKTKDDLNLTSAQTKRVVTLSEPEGICTDGSVQSCFARYEGERVRVTNGRIGVTFVPEQIAWEDYE